MLENSETKLLSVGLNHLNLKTGFTVYLSKWLSEKNKFSPLSLIVEFPVFVLFTHEKQVCVGNFFKKSCFSASTRYADLFAPLRCFTGCPHHPFMFCCLSLSLLLSVLLVFPSHCPCVTLLWCFEAVPSLHNAVLLFLTASSLSLAAFISLMTLLLHCAFVIPDCISL